MFNLFEGGKLTLRSSEIIFKDIIEASKSINAKELLASLNAQHETLDVEYSGITPAAYLAQTHNKQALNELLNWGASYNKALLGLLLALDIREAEVFIEENRDKLHPNLIGITSIIDATLKGDGSHLSELQSKYGTLDLAVFGYSPIFILSAVKQLNEDAIHLLFKLGVDRGSAIRGVAFRGDHSYCYELLEINNYDSYAIYNAINGAAWGRNFTLCRELIAEGVRRAGNNSKVKFDFYEAAAEGAACGGHYAFCLEVFRAGDQYTVTTGCVENVSSSHFRFKHTVDSAAAEGAARGGHFDFCIQLISEGAKRIAFFAGAINGGHLRSLFRERYFSSDLVEIEIQKASFREASLATRDLAILFLSHVKKESYRKAFVSDYMYRCEIKPSYSIDEMDAVLEEAQILSHFVIAGINYHCAIQRVKELRREYPALGNLALANKAERLAKSIVEERKKELLDKAKSFKKEGQPDRRIANSSYLFEDANGQSAFLLRHHPVVVGPFAPARIESATYTENYYFDHLPSQIYLYDFLQFLEPADLVVLPGAYISSLASMIWQKALERDFPNFSITYDLYESFEKPEQTPLIDYKKQYQAALDKQYGDLADWEKRLFLYIIRNNLGAIRELSFDIQTLFFIRDADGLDPFQWCIERDRPVILEYFYQKACQDIFQGVDKDKNGHSQLYWACLCGQLDQIDLLMTAQSSDYGRPLYLAAKSGNVHAARHILKRFPEIIDARKETTSALIVASTLGRSRMVKYLVEELKINGISVDALYTAAQSGFFSLVRFMIENKYIQVDSCDKQKVTMLFRSAMAGMIDVMIELLELGADVNQPLPDYKCYCPGYSTNGHFKFFPIRRDYVYTDAEKPLVNAKTLFEFVKGSYRRRPDIYQIMLLYNRKLPLVERVLGFLDISISNTITSKLTRWFSPSSRTPEEVLFYALSEVREPHQLRATILNYFPLSCSLYIKPKCEYLLNKAEFILQPSKTATISAQPRPIYRLTHSMQIVSVVSENTGYYDPRFFDRQSSASKELEETKTIHYLSSANPGNAFGTG